MENLNSLNNMPDHFGGSWEPRGNTDLTKIKWPAVDLRSLTSLPEDIDFSIGGNIDLTGLPGIYESKEMKALIKEEQQVDRVYLLWTIGLSLGIATAITVFLACVI